MRKKDWWTPSEMFELLNEGSIEIKEFDMEWVEAEVVKQDLVFVESSDIETENKNDKLVETETIDLLPKLKPVYLHKTKPVALNRLKSVCLTKLKPVCIDKLTPVSLIKLRPVCIDKLTPVFLGRLRPVCINRLKPVCVSKLKPVDIEKKITEGVKAVFDLRPVCLTKINVDISKPEYEVVQKVVEPTVELKPVCLSKIFVDLTKPEPLNYGLEDVKVEENAEIKENGVFEDTPVEDVEDTEPISIEEPIENEPENIVTLEKPEGIKLDKNGSGKYSPANIEEADEEDDEPQQVEEKGKFSPATVTEVDELGDITQALNKGALFMDFGEDDDEDESEEERLREEEILRQRAIRREEAKKKAEEEALRKEQNSKKFGKILLIAIISVVLLIEGTVGALLLWNSEGSNVNKLVDSAVEMARPVPVVLPIVMADGTEEEIEFLHVGFTDLMKRNNNTVAWLKSEPLGLNYPIVQSLDNDFYLTHDIDKKKNAAGWLFLDCEVDLRSEPFNAVIYGHNRRDKVVFGNLKSLLDNNFATGKKEDFIYFTTMSTAYIYEICSVYVADKSNSLPYTVDFKSQETKQEFIDNMIKSNQAPQFVRDDLTVDDKFLTLSTCHGGSGTTKRLIVHCRLKYKAQNAGG